MCPSVCLIGLLQREQKYKSLSGAQSLATSTENDSYERASDTQCQHDLRISGRNIYDADARQTICTWMFHTVDYLDQSRELAHISMHCIDRYACLVPIDSTINLNLGAIAALSVVLKANDNGRQKSHSNYLKWLLAMSKQAFTVEDITDMEMRLLHKLSWNVNPPTPQAFLEEFNQLWNMSRTFEGVFSPVNSIILEVANYVVDCTLFLSIFQNQPRSLIALAALLLSMKDVKSSVLTPSMKQKAIDVIISYFQIGSYNIPNPLTFCQASDMAFEMESALFGDEDAIDSVSSYATIISLYSAIDPNGYVYNHNLLLNQSIYKESNGTENVNDIPDLPNRKRKSSALVSP